jgi:hypothetical protein
MTEKLIQCRNNLIEISNKLIRDKTKLNNYKLIKNYEVNQTPFYASPGDTAINLGREFMCRK